MGDESSWKRAPLPERPGPERHAKRRRIMRNAASPRRRTNTSTVPPAPEWTAEAVQPPGLVSGPHAPGVFVVYGGQLAANPQLMGLPSIGTVQQQKVSAS